ncbi:GcrA family cell cycle regulator [Polymorphobacter fuscus]|uniref:Global cell cycle regulator GcrA-like protein n=1 Tax=Sandarakinorhabdus fusca TaxID=1439888 RepID=A0A7C9KGT7_9SPHN|nr:GcrA family cell cycle regulator [Polymorphobacter fuscus]KAB7648423.1 global cell cycle regulator GcrA-like protein [Polymorphobacter fuscus]MQT15941.1 global cell cycle regulator GcrA-like protein [Polymorphobacter fuscus]NJC07783.1 GcrA cell cycle regulator [Polymorphobacter fuscus]
MAWTDERIAQLKAGWEGGMTASQIAEALGEGVSRNAVIGKAHRLGLESRPSPVKGTEDVAAAPAAKPVATAAPAAVVPVSVPTVPRPAVAKKPARTGKAARTTLLDLNEKICKWPIGHPGDADFHFCGKSAQAGFPYCTEHCLVAYQAQLPRRDRDRRPPPQMPGMPRR